jgi:hypothetical protein
VLPATVVITPCARAAGAPKRTKTKREQRARQLLHLMATASNSFRAVYHHQLRSAEFVAIPAKKITHSDAMSITLGAKRRWRRLCWPD